MEAAALSKSIIYTEAENTYNRLLDENQKDKMFTKSTKLHCFVARVGNEAKAMKVMSK